MSPLTPQEFARRWSGSTLSERSSYQQHFLDLCEMLGQPTPAATDRVGEFYTFEKSVQKAGGGKGFADVWRKDRFAIEYKGRHKDLSAALNQLLRYQGSLGNPPLLMVTDTERYEVHTTFSGVKTETYSFTNETLPDPENLRVLRAMFEDPDSLRPARTVQSITEEAAAKFARIADGIRDRGVDSQRAAHFLNRLLFCLFAEDVGLLPKKLFERVAERGVRRPETFNRNIGDLFGAMAEGGEFLLEDILRFNGGLFADAESVPLESGELRVLLEAARLDWGSVEPAIFGTLFERSLDPALRAKLGAHYTSREDILAVLEPVLMSPLRREWDEVREGAGAEATQAGTLSGRRAESALRRAEGMLLEFARRLRNVRVLDPACGSGNFLTVSLGLLQEMEQEVIDFARGIGLTPPFPEVGPEQMFGIETSPYAHELAQVAVWISYLQWRMKYGYGPGPEPILGPMTNIRETDALIERGEDGALREPEWPEADAIVSNPPFLGDKRMRTKLGHGYVESLRKLYKGRVPGGADLVCYWFERARKQISADKARRAGLIATQAIRVGANRRVLQRIKSTGDIFEALSDRPWVLDGADVRVSVVCFDDGTEQERRRDNVPVASINADLSSDLDLTAAAALVQNRRIAFVGTQKGGSFELSPNLAEDMLQAPRNPNGRPNSDVVRPWISGWDITGRPRGKWIIDFGARMPKEQAYLYEAPFEYVREHVLPVREKLRRENHKRYWWLHAESRPGMRKALDNLSRYIVTPRVAKHRIFVFADAAATPDSRLAVIARQDHYFFGVLHSHPHEAWSLATSPRHGVGNDPTYNTRSCFETFPLPWPPGEEPGEDDDPRVLAIAQAARRLDELRRNWLDPEGAGEPELKKRTLTNLYNARPTWLANAHAALDAAVFAAYGWPADLPDEEILKYLLALNAECAG